MNPTRRSIVAGAAAAAGTALAATAQANLQDKEVKPASSGARVSNPIAVSTYSFWRFREDSRIDIPRCIELAAEYGFDAVELLLVQFDKEATDPKFLQSLKRQCLVNGLALCGMSTHQGFVTPDARKRMAEVHKTIHQIELAYQLGIPTIRVNTGRWGTSGSFDELMANKGIEPPLEGYTDEQAFPWVIEALELCMPVAEKCGVVLGLENHWGLGRTAEGVLRIHDAINSPWLGVTMDTGNFLEDQYAQFEALAPHAVFMQAKTYPGGGTWYTLEIDYDRIADICRKHNYNGYISLEFEGKDHYTTAIPESLAMLRNAFARKQ